jgi:hypothetical protein
VNEKDQLMLVFGGYEDDGEAARQERLQGGGKKKQTPQVS